MFRAQPCRWFELAGSRDELTPLLHALARTGAVELQTHERRAAPLFIEGAEQLLERFGELDKTFRSHWPAPRHRVTPRVADPGATLAASLARLEAWRHGAEPVIAEHECSIRQAQDLADLAKLLAVGADQLPEPRLLAAAGRFMIEMRLYALTDKTPAAAALPAGLLQRVMADPDAATGKAFLLLVGRADDIALADTTLQTLGARRIVWPAGLSGSLAQAAEQVQTQRQQLSARGDELTQDLQALNKQHAVADALSDIGVVTWLMRHGADLAAGEHLVWVTGWTTAADETAFCAPLEQQGLRCVVDFPAPPPLAVPPAVLVNPPWIRAFEPFARMLGQPGSDEADPSLVVALFAPLLFGFMFGDLGQGAVLCVAGWLLRRRAPMLVLLIPGGAMAMVFGLLFGTVFAREDLIPALWLHPLDQPMTLLVASVGLGAVILLCGLVLNALQTHWQLAARPWWQRDAGLVLAYVSLLAALAWPEMLWLAAVGAGWFMLGSMFAATPGAASRLSALGSGVAKFAELALQLLVNTVSFARVGAFALAHAGLSTAVTGVAEAAGGVGYWIVLLLGNALILLLEGLVVGIQTTRLLLFEFFVRFLQGSGRVFRPLPMPVGHTLTNPESQVP